MSGYRLDLEVGAKDLALDVDNFRRALGDLGYEHAARFSIWVAFGYPEDAALEAFLEALDEDARGYLQARIRDGLRAEPKR